MFFIFVNQRNIEGLDLFVHTEGFGAKGAHAHDFILHGGVQAVTFVIGVGQGSGGGCPRAVESEAVS